jgi:type IV/VI secretion system ImpK/VasF family protein
VGEQTFAESQEESVASADAFESVDEALPAADQRFAPPESRDDVDVAQDRDTPQVVQESRDTVEVVQESRNTVEVVQESRDTMEVQNDFGDTLEVVEPEPPASTFDETLEIEEKTDEFEIVTAPVDTEGPADDMGGDTAQVSRETLLERLLFWRKKEKAKIVEGGGTVVEGNPVFLFSKFRAFYNEIIRFKHQKSEFTAGFATAIVTEYSADLSPDAAAEALSKKLMEMLELQAAEAKWMGGEAGERYPDAQYAMAALADETFTHMEWEGQAAWPKFLLEVKLYKTRAADVELFRRIDKLLKDKPNSPVARDMARVYLLVIAAGFRGKYRPFGLTRALAEYRQRLYEFVHEGDALMLYAADRKIFPEAASRTLEGHAVSRFTAAQRWAAILIFLVVGYTVLAHFAWNRVSADLKDVTDRIMGSTATGAP